MGDEFIVAFNSSSVASSPSGDLSPVELKPVERQVEARPVDDALGSMVRCLYFARSYIISSKHRLGCKL